MPSLLPFKVLSAVAVLDNSLPGWTLLDVPATAVRAFSLPIAFERGFSASPVVHVGMVGLDVGKDDNVRLRLRAVDVTPTGFTLHLESWFNTQVWSVEASWLAIGV